jgi:S-formylglutathione hydrolase
MNRFHGVTVLATIFLLLAITTRAAAPAAEAGEYQRVTVHGVSLVGNLEGDSPDRLVSIYLPPGYARNPQRRYPVVYLLHGFTDTDTNWFGRANQHFVHVPKAADSAYAAGVSEFILVMPNAFTKYQGSMYSNSAAVGDWETFVARELVAWVDAHYRTLANPASRGLAGHSMGGYGTLRIAMKQPGVFSAIYAMSSCCLAPNPNPDAKMFERAAQVRTDQDITAADFFTKALLASAAAWSPDPRKPPLYIGLPVADGKLLPDIASLWNANMPNVMVHQYLPALRTYKAIGIEAGDQDPVAIDGSKQLHGLLESYSIPHVYETYEGDHVNRIHERITTRLLPFFASHLRSSSR